jgi:O-antigen ligase/Tfp pilus assembly protein PilF
VEGLPERTWTYRVLRAGMAGFVVLLVLAMFPYTARPTLDIKVLLSQVFAGTLLILFLVHFVWTRRTFERPPVLFAILVPLLTLYIVAALASDYAGNSLAEASKWAGLVALYFVASQIYLSARSIQTLFIVIAVAVAVSSLYAFAQKAGMDPFPWQEQAKGHAVYQRLPGTFGNPDFAGHTLVLALVLVVYLTTLRRTRWCVLLAAPLLAHIWLIQQRSALLALGAASMLALLAVAVRRLVRRPSAAVLAAGAAVAIAGLVTAVAAAGWAIHVTGRLAPMDESGRLRAHAFQSAVTMIQSKPLLGYGPGNYKIVNTPFWTEYEQEWFAHERLMNFNVHNDFLEAAVDAGLLGGLLYTAFLALGVGAGIYLYVAREERTERRLALALAAAFMAFAVDGFFGFNVRVPASAGLIFILAGTLDGFFAGTHLARPSVLKAERTYFWPLLIALAAVANMVFAGIVFRSEWYYQRGMGADQWQAYSEAEEAYTHGENLAPWNWLFPFRRGLTSTARGNRDEAAAHFQRALSKNPYYIPAMNHLAQNQFNRGAPALLGAEASAAVIEESHALLDRAAANAAAIQALCPSWAEAEDILGRVAFVRGTWLSAARGGPDHPVGNERQLWEQAAEHLARAVELGLSTSQEPLRLLAQIHVLLENPEQAERFFYKALAADLHGDMVWPAFWDYARTTGAYPVMLAALQWHARRLRQLDGGPHDEALAKVYVWTARLHDEGMNDHAAAEEAYCRGVQAAPLKRDVWGRYAQFAAEAGYEEGFRQCLMEVVQKALADNAAALPEVLAAATALRGGAENVVRAAAMLAEAAEADLGRTPGLAWAAPYVLAEVREADGPEEAARAQALLGTVFETLGRWEAAAELLQQALGVLEGPEHSVAALRLAAIQAQMDQPHEALRVLDEAMGRDPHNGELHLQYARALARAGRPAQARLEYRMFLNTYAVSDDLLGQIQEELTALAPQRPPE